MINRENSFGKESQFKAWLSLFVLQTEHVNNLWQETIKFRTFPQLARLLFVLQVSSRKTLQLYKKSKYWSLKVWLVWLGWQSGTKHFEKSKETKQNMTGPEMFDICFCGTLARYYQSFVSRTETGHSTMSPSNFKILLLR